MSEYRIKCATCGSDRVSEYKTTKYCTVCRMASNLLFIGDRTQKCYVCRQEFAPLSRGDLYCGKCDRNRRSYNVTGHCAFCDRQDRTLLRDEIRICIECAKDPEKRGAFLNATLKRQDERLKNPVVIPPTPLEKAASDAQLPSIS